MKVSYMKKSSHNHKKTDICIKLHVTDTQKYIFLSTFSADTQLSNFISVYEVLYRTKCG